MATAHATDLTDRDLQIIYSRGAHELYQWMELISQWGWPDALPDPPPQDSLVDTTPPRLLAVYQAIDDAIRKKGGVMTDSDREALERRPTESLASAWRQLNEWGWPPKLPPPETKDSGKNRRSEIMAWIEKRIGKKACLKAGPSPGETDTRGPAR